jgi:hypothetical protein
MILKKTASLCIFPWMGVYVFLTPLNLVTIGIFVLAKIDKLLGR